MLGFILTSSLISSSVNIIPAPFFCRFCQITLKLCIPYHHFSVFSFHLQTQVAVMKKQIQTILPHFLKQEITRLNNTCRNLDILRLKLWLKNKKLPYCKKNCTTVSDTILLLSYFFHFSLLLICKHISCFFSMGRVSKKTQITGKSIGKKDNQMSSGIQLELGAINRPEWLLHPFLFSQVYVH